MIYNVDYIESLNWSVASLAHSQIHAHAHAHAELWHFHTAVARAKKSMSHIPTVTYKTIKNTRNEHK